MSRQAVVFKKRLDPKIQPSAVGDTAEGISSGEVTWVQVLRKYLKLDSSLKRSLKTHFHFVIEVALEPQKEGGFVAFVPSLPGCLNEGETEEEAINKIKDTLQESIKLYLADEGQIPFVTPEKLSARTIVRQVTVYV